MGLFDLSVWVVRDYFITVYFHYFQSQNIMKNINFYQIISNTNDYLIY